LKGTACAAAAVVALAAAAATTGAACDTVDLGAPPADVNACRPSQSYFVTDVWPNVLNVPHGGKKCSDASCHDTVTAAGGFGLIANPQPALDPAMPPPMPLPDDWAMNYLKASQQMTCTDVAASNLIIYPTGMHMHGGGQLFTASSMEVTTLKDWVSATP
jgi:hypothetical protein